jgi:Periplasmic binding protein domain
LLAAIAVTSLLETVPAAEGKPTIPIIVKDTTTFFWQIVLAGARKAGRELNVTVPQLGAQSEFDINGQISILENAVSGRPAAVVIAQPNSKRWGQPIDETAKRSKLSGLTHSLQGMIGDRVCAVRVPNCEARASLYTLLSRKVTTPQTGRHDRTISPLDGALPMLASNGVALLGGR